MSQPASRAQLHSPQPFAGLNKGKFKSDISNSQTHSLAKLSSQQSSQRNTKKIIDYNVSPQQQQMMQRGGIDMFNSEHRHNLESNGESQIRNMLAPFEALSPQKGYKEHIEGTDIFIDDRTDKALHQIVEERSNIKVRFSQVRGSETSQIEGQQIAQYIEEKKVTFIEFLTEQRSKVKHCLGSVDKHMWSGLDAELKVNLQDPFVRAEQVLLLIDEKEMRLNNYILAQSLQKLHQFQLEMSSFQELIQQFVSDVHSIKAFIYFNKKMHVQQDTLHRQLKSQSQEIKLYIDSSIQELKQFEQQSMEEVVHLQHFEQYKSELEQPYKDMSREIDDIKRSYHEMITMMDKQRQKKLKEQELSKFVQQLAVEIENQKVQSNQKDEFLGQRYDIVHKQCEEQEKLLKKLRKELNDYIEHENARRKQNWRVDFGEEAKIITESVITSMLQLSNGTVAVAAYQPGTENHIIEVYDTSSDFEKSSTVFSFHTANIQCLAEHRKLLLTGSIDCTIGFWDISNNFQLLHQYRHSSDEPITSLLSVDQRYFLSSCSRGSLKIWDSVNNTLASNKLNAHTQGVNQLNLLSKFRVVSCSRDKSAIVWQLQGSNMQKVYDLHHNSSVVTCIDLKHNDSIATITHQGYAYVWDLTHTHSQKPQKLYKFDSEKIISAYALLDYDFKLFPFIICQTADGEIQIMQVSTGKTQKLKYQSPISKDIKKSEEGHCKLIQSDSQHVVVSSDFGESLRVLSIEFENIKDSLIEVEQ